MTGTVLRRLIAIVALTVGIGVTVGTASAAADTPASAPASSSSFVTSAPVGATASDWWWGT